MSRKILYGREEAGHNSIQHLVISLEVPWQDGSGLIPPPTIAFFDSGSGQDMVFTYLGAE